MASSLLGDARGVLFIALGCISTGAERWSREPIWAPAGTKRNPAIVPSFNTSRVVGLETEQGVIWFKLEKGPLHLVDGQYFKPQQLDGGDH